jgi:hypothetical protein
MQMFPSAAEGAQMTFRSLASSQASSTPELTVTRESTATAFNELHARKEGVRVARRGA